jgi:hypothetical protein
MYEYPDENSNCIPYEGVHGVYVPIDNNLNKTPVKGRAPVGFKNMNRNPTHDIRQLQP